MTEPRSSAELDRERLSTSLNALRRDLDSIDNEIAAPLLSRRRYVVDVVWTIKEATGFEPISVALEEATDRARLAGGMDAGVVAILRAVREATRPS